jgi:Tfp pilus assembly protein PilX
MHGLLLSRISANALRDKYILFDRANREAEERIRNVATRTRSPSLRATTRTRFSLPSCRLLGDVRRLAYLRIVPSGDWVLKALL